MVRHLIVCSATALAAALALSAPASALTMKECGAKYQAAKQANTLNGMKWNDYRKANCGDEDVSDADAAAAVKEDDKTAAKPAAKPAAKTVAKPADQSAPATKPTTAAAGKVAFPTEVSSKYASETPGKARMHTCLDQYNANKQANGGTAPMKWIEKGGGYYSQCNAKLKS